MSRKNANKQSREEADVTQVADEQTPAAVEAEEQSGTATDCDTCEEEVASLGSELEQLRGELAAANDRYLRTLAEFDNFRRRTRQEQAVTRVRAREETVMQLLPVLDDLQRLLEQDLAKLTMEALLSGAKMATEKFGQLLEGMQVKPFVSQGEEFNPELHDALTTMCDPNQEDGIIIAEHLKGYKSGDTVIRHAQVVVNRREEN